MKEIQGGYVLQPRCLDYSSVAKMPPATREIWLYIVRKVYYHDNPVNGIKRGSGFFTYKQIKEDLCWYAGYRKITYSKNDIAKSLRRLCESFAIDTTKETRGLIITVCKYDFYQDQQNYEGNNEGSTKETRRKHNESTIHKRKYKKKENKDIPMRGIVDFLNETTGAKYKHSTAKTRALISARFKEGFSVDDFKTVIKGKFEQWADDDKMAKFLRPETLFSNKFESYLNETYIQTEQKEEKLIFARNKK